MPRSVIDIDQLRQLNDVSSNNFILNMYRHKLSHIVYYGCPYSGCRNKKASRNKSDIVKHIKLRHQNANNNSMNNQNASSTQNNTINNNNSQNNTQVNNIKKNKNKQDINNLNINRANAINPELVHTYVSNGDMYRVNGKPTCFPMVQLPYHQFTQIASQINNNAQIASQINNNTQIANGISANLTSTTIPSDKKQENSMQEENPNMEQAKIIPKSTIRRKSSTARRRSFVHPKTGSQRRKSTPILTQVYNPFLGYQPGFYPVQEVKTNSDEVKEQSNDKKKLTQQQQLQLQKLQQLQQFQQLQQLQFSKQQQLAQFSKQQQQLAQFSKQQQQLAQFSKQQQQMPYSSFVQIDPQIRIPTPNRAQNSQISHKDKRRWSAVSHPMNHLPLQQQGRRSSFQPRPRQEPLYIIFEKDV